MNYRKLNASFFLVGVIFCLLVEGINSVVMGIKFSNLLIVILISVCIIAICFYRFNNGVIAILKGRFAKPRKTDLHFVDYDLVKNKDELISATSGSLLVYKLNSRDSYQIIKQSDRLLIRKVNIGDSVEDSNLVSDDFDSVKFARGDISVRYDSLTRVTYKISPDNYYEPIIEIIVGKKHYRYIGYINPLLDSDIKLFFSDIIKVKSLNKSNDRVEKRLENDKRVMAYNILKLVASIFVPNTLLSHAVTVDNKNARIITSIYMIVCVSTMIIFALLPIINPKKYGLFIDEYDKSQRDKVDVAIGPMTIGLLLLIAVVSYETPTNTGWYLFLVGVVFLALFIAFLFRNGITNTEKTKKWEQIIISLFIFGIMSASIVSGINYSIPVKSRVETFHISDRHIESRSKGGDDYYVTVRVDGHDKNVKVDLDTFEDNNSIIKLERTRGILGVEYIAH